MDEGFIVLFEEGRSYTGEQSFEVSCHGSPQTVRRILNEIIKLGARAAEPGEFTERAFLNGRLDLTRAEAIREAIEADTEAQRRRAGLLRQGKLADAVGELQGEVGAVLARAEASVDFSEEIGELDREAAAKDIESCIARIGSLLAGYGGSRLIRQGLRVAIAGRPNVGKSSLLNALLRTERAIVTEVPGTTRDTIEETASIAGYPVVLTDTAGIRDSADAVELLGIERSRAALESADEIWFVFEAHRGWTRDDEMLLESAASAPTLFIANKSDLGTSGETPPGRGVSVSALSGTGLEAVEVYVKERFEEGAASAPPLINERHREDLLEAKALLEHAIETLASDLPADFVCVDLYGVMSVLGRITGETAPDEIIERVFRDFCIGK